MDIATVDDRIDLGWNIENYVTVSTQPAGSALAVTFNGGANNLVVNNGMLNLASPVSTNGFHSLTVYASNLDAAKASLYSAVVNANTSTSGILDAGLGSHPDSSGGTLYIRPTRVGDLNLDGSVTISDFIDLASHFNMGTWQQGDLNYDGNVSISDFI